MTKTFDFDFDEGPLGFVAGFADYPPAHEEIYGLTSGHRALPAPLASQSGLFISGVNRSDYLFMFFKGSIDGLTLGASYGVEVSVEIATSTPADCIGVGGAPGESVWIKAGVTAEEPVAVMDDSYLRMNIDIGNQSNSGTQAVVLGVAPDGRRFGIREPDGGVFHASGGHAGAGFGGVRGGGCYPMEQPADDRVSGDFDRGYGFPVERAARVAVHAVTSSLGASPSIEKVTLCCCSKESAEAHRVALDGAG